jgi:hypothetical protein
LIAPAPAAAAAGAPPPTSWLAGGNNSGREAPYTGPLPTTFEYKIINTRDLDSRGLLADAEAMALLLNVMNAFVAGVVAAVFGNGAAPTAPEDHNGRSSVRTNLFNHGKEGPLQGRAWAQSPCPRLREATRPSGRTLSRTAPVQVRSAATTARSSGAAATGYTCGSGPT